MTTKEKLGIYFVACDFFWAACALWYELDFHPRNRRPYSNIITIDALAQAILDQEHAVEDYLQVTIENDPTRDEAYEKHGDDLVNLWVEFHSLIQKFGVELGDGLKRRYELEMDQSVVKWSIKETNMIVTRLQKLVAPLSNRLICGR